MGRDDQTRCAEPTLNCAGLDECGLDRMQLVAGGQTLDSDDLAALGLAGGDETGAREHPVEVDRARTALALLTSVLGPGQAHPLAKHVEQALAGPDVVDLASLAVDGHRDPHVRPPFGSLPRPNRESAGP